MNANDPATALQLPQAMALHQRGRLAEAKLIYQQILEQEPQNFDALYLLGTLAAQSGDAQGAIQFIDQAIAIQPAVAPAHNNRGLALALLGRLDEALASYDRALQLDPQYAEAHNNRGNALFNSERPAEALASYDRALAAKPDYAEAHNNRGQALSRLDRLSDALASYDRALALAPGYALAHNNRGNALASLQRLDEALASYDRALSIHPRDAQTHNNRGHALVKLKRIDEALASFEHALAIKADYAEAHNHRGVALLHLRRPDEALASHRRAIALRPDYVEAYRNQAIALMQLGRHGEAVAYCDRALDIQADVKTWLTRGNALSALKRQDDALQSYARAVELDPRHEHPELRATLMHARMRVCDWRDFEPQTQALGLMVAESSDESTPFAVLALFDDPPLQLTVARHCCKQWPAPPASVSAAPSGHHQKIRVGYYSADFHDHATCHLMAGLFEAHDKSRFEWFAFSFGPEKHDAMRRRVAAAFDHFHDVRLQSDEQVAQLSRRLGIDIAVDLKGFTADARPGIFAHRCAPVQVNYLGYPGSMGADFIDYLLADRVVIAPQQRAHYSEKIIYLPHSYQVNDDRREISRRQFTRHELGLPPTGFVFCCFNNNYKILPQVFGVWMDLLHAVPGSVLWLLEDSPTAAKNLRAQAQQRGVNADRLVFAPRIPLPDHLARHRLADLFLDTAPYNAHTTASDALWAGLPVLTCAGQSFAARVAASLLTALDLPELITDSWPAYRDLAIMLAGHPDRLAGLRRKLEEHRRTRPLFDTRQFARDLESAYQSMHERRQKGLPPADAAVNASDTLQPHAGAHPTA
ncbi:tetratricopeptide repeat protein [Ottowia sp.]|uniref:tetratricopeptide repeat protein n=1 Tax=Ottowia sp. TaxID=1898956 RepID=UPI002B9548FD|nr:tetratricopeptide repeat protein [Ottowia sp.]HOB67874.1 tetratricopeptide repeat protein [Ottowia sp.]HPZ55727.1 tetratricopeptide repeat protein [Ottowia sp.]HQD46344.1 tetratricopeptide repeat protein [Ottowia sp.]